MSGIVIPAARISRARWRSISFPRYPMLSSVVEHTFEWPYGKHSPMTKFRTGLILGFAAGYYLGAQAGRERYEQLNRLLQRALQSDAIDHASTAVGKARAVIDLTRERVVDLTERRPVVAQSG